MAVIDIDHRANHHGYDHGQNDRPNIVVVYQSHDTAPLDSSFAMTLTWRPRPRFPAGIVAAAAAIVFLFCAESIAEPLRCAGEHQACVASCTKLGDPSKRICVTNCAQRQAACVRTGCWDDGTRNYCGLLRR
jgi:hypothetical protein